MAEYRYIALVGKYGEGKFAKVDASKFDELSQYRWSCMPKGYAFKMLTINGKRKSVLMHRLVMLGADFLDSPVQVDHRDRNRLHNYLENLRPATREQNAQNSRGRDRLSQYKGIHFTAKTGNWAAQLKVEGVRYHLGTFPSEVEAAKAYDGCARHYFGEFAVTNFPGSESFDFSESRLRASYFRGSFTSHYFGVSRDKRKWRCSFQIKGVVKTMKCFDTEIEAAVYHDSLVVKYGAKRPLNFPAVPVAAP